MGVRRVRRSVYCTASFSVCSRRRTELPIIYADFRLDYKLATLPPWGFRGLAKNRRWRAGLLQLAPRKDAYHPVSDNRLGTRIFLFQFAYNRQRPGTRP